MQETTEIYATWPVLDELREGHPISIERHIVFGGDVVGPARPVEAEP